jgi:hypothetical protein
MVVKWRLAVIELDDYYLVPTVSVRFRKMGKLRRLHIGLTVLNREFQVARIWADIERSR